MFIQMSLELHHQHTCGQENEKGNCHCLSLSEFCSQTLKGLFPILCLGQNREPKIELCRRALLRFFILK